MSLKLKKRFLVYSLSSLFCLSYNTVANSLPITLDGSLGTRVEMRGNKVFIDGGTQKGSNLFHSTSQFSIPQNIEAKFLNGLNINNIFLRVTGGDISNIDGTISALGGANFWLLNPSGVIFGPNAKLDIGGSFNVIAGGNITFADGIEFGVNTDGALLTQSAPVGVNFPGGKPPASVIILGDGHTFTNQITLRQPTKETAPNQSENLTVSESQNINIAANQIILDGGRLSSDGGNIKLLAIERGKINLNDPQKLSINPNITLGNIKLENKALIYATSANSNTAPGSIELIGKTITFTDNSIVLSQNNSSQQASDIKVFARESFTLIDEHNNPDRDYTTGIYSEMNAGETTWGANIYVTAEQLNMTASNFLSSTIDRGKAGDIKIDGKNLNMRERSVITSLTKNKGRSGDILIDFSEKVSLIGGSPDKIQEFNTGIGVINNGFGSSGEVRIFSDELLVLNGSRISTNVLPEVLARLANPELNSAKIEGTSNDVSIFANTIKIEGSGVVKFPGRTDTRLDRSTIGTNTASSVDAGNLKVQVKQLFINDGGELLSTSIGSGNAGKVKVDATNSIILNQGKIVGSIRPINDLSEEVFDLPNTSIGRIESINLTAPKLELSNNSEITVSNLGTNAAGVANINADRIQLENSKITATTSAGSGQLNINSKDFRIFNSQITTAAAGEGTGGDININSDIFLANSSSQITATAVEGNGGNITIRGNDGIFISADSIVSADSQSGVDGTVNIEGITSEQIGNELSFYNIRKAEEEQQQPPTTFTSDCVEESLTATSGVNPKYDPYRDPDSPLSGLTPPEQTSEADNELLKHYATGIIMAKVPQDESQLLDYLREHFEDVRVSPSGVIQTGEIKNLEKIEIPADWFKRSFNYLEICQ